MNYPEGEFLIAAYDFESDPKNYQHLLKTKRTTYFKKSKVAKLIVLHEFRRTGSFSILPERFIQLAKLVIECFPRLTENSFYCATSGNKSAGGALQSAYSKQREKEIAIGRCSSTTLKRKICEVLATESESEELQELQKVVKVVDEHYKIKWKSTAFLERIEIYKNCSIDESFEKFPNLMNVAGYTLIEIDYAELYPTFDNFHTNWSKVAPKIIDLARRKIKKKDCEITAILREFDLDTDHEHQNLDLEVTAALLLLPYLFKRITKKTSRAKGGITWKPTCKETLDGFIFHIKEKEDLNSNLTEVNNLLKKVHESNNVELRPYVVIEGNSLKHIKSAHVILGKWSYQTTSTTKAVDLCFKCCKVFKKPYSVLCNHVWEFIEASIYNKTCTTSVSVSNVIEQLQTV